MGMMTKGVRCEQLRPMCYTHAGAINAIAVSSAGPYPLDIGIVVACGMAAAYVCAQQRAL